MDLPALVVSNDLFNGLLAKPEMLWLLAALPVFYLLSLPPKPKTKVITAHMRQWQRALSKLRRRPTRFRRLRFWLMIIAATAAILAASQPSLRGAAGPRHLIVLCDDSASMASAAKGERSAWHRARALLAAILPDLPAKVTIQLALSGAGRILRGSAEEILARLPQSPSGVPLIALATLAADLVDDDHAVWTITDGRDFAAVPVVGALSLVGQDLANLGLTACELTDHWPLPTVEVTLRAADFGLEKREIAIDVRGGGGPERIPLSLEAGVGELSFELARGQGGYVDFRIEGSTDALEADDHLRIWIPPPPAPDIALLSESESSLWLRKAGEVLASESGGQVVVAASERAQFLLVEGGQLAAPWGRGMSFGTAFGVLNERAGQQRSDPSVLDWDRSDPVTRGLDFSDLVIERAIDAKFLPPGNVLLWADDGALLVLAGTGTTRSLHSAFQLSDSNLPLLPAFPQLLRRAFARCYGGSLVARIEAGSPLSAPESDLRLESTLPSERPLPDFAEPGASLAVPLLLLALMAMALRVYA